MPHVKTQIRNAVKARLATVPALLGVYDESRIARGFQNDEFPVALVAVSETASREDKNPEGQRTLRRNLTVSIRLAVQDDDEDVEDVLDDACVAVEKALAVSADLGVGKLIGWAYAGTTSLDPLPMENGTLLSVVTTYTCSVLTLDVAPDTNLF